MMLTCVHESPVSYRKAGDLDSGSSFTDFGFKGWGL